MMVLCSKEIQFILRPRFDFRFVWLKLSRASEAVGQRPAGDVEGKRQMSMQTNSQRRSVPCCHIGKVQPFLRITIRESETREGGWSRLIVPIVRSLTIGIETFYRPAAGRLSSFSSLRKRYCTEYNTRELSTSTSLERLNQQQPWETKTTLKTSTNKCKYTSARHGRLVWGIWVLQPGPF